MFLEDVSGLTRWSNKRVLCECDAKISEKCFGNKLGMYCDFITNIENNGKYICLYCSRKISSSRENNTATKHYIDDNYFSNIDSEEKAYILGWIASDGAIHKKGWSILVHKKDWRILYFIKDAICPSLKIYKYKQYIRLNVYSSKMSLDLCSLLKIGFSKKSHIVQMPELESNELLWCFLRGYFDGDGSVNSPSKSYKYPACNITSNSKTILEQISKFSQIPNCISGSQIVFSGNNALDFLSKLYDNANVCLHRKRDRYLDWCYWIPSLQGYYGHEGLFSWSKTDTEAIPPFKFRASDAGFDLTLIREVKRTGNVILYGTGLKIQPEYGWWFELVPRSSIIKTGYIMANSVGIIDRTYCGEILVPLLKFDRNAPDLQLPCRIVQIIPRIAVHCQIKEVENFELTERDDKGFGSSG